MLPNGRRKFGVPRNQRKFEAALDHPELAGRKIEALPELTFEP
jgi:hypothetical protein